MNDLPVDLSSTLLSASADLMSVEGVTVGEVEPRVPIVKRNGKPVATAVQRPPEERLIPKDAVRLRGRLLVPSEQAYARLAERLHPLGLTPVMRKGQADDEVVVAALPGTIAQSRPNVQLAVVLFVLTALSCLFVGAQMTEAVQQSGRLNTNLLDGLPYAVPLLAILASHEFGHYLVARRLGAPVSLPYFIPMPLTQLGTMGAVINMPAPPRNRRQLFAVALAGPLAGLIVCLPILWIGLGMSPVLPLPAGPYQMEGQSILYSLIKFLHFGRMLPGGGYDVFIGTGVGGQIAFAGWVGLLVTGLNLIPAGQLDGGHIVYALLGPKWAERILWVVLLGLAALSFLWLGWLLWVALIFFFSRVRMPLLDDTTGLTNGQRVLAVLMVIVFVLVFMPVPWSVVQ